MNRARHDQSQLRVPRAMKNVGQVKDWRSLPRTGFFIDTFSCPVREGILWLHGFGNVFEVTLGHGEQIDIEPGGWIYKDRTVQMQTMFQKLSTGLFASGGQIVWNRFTGPGKIALQTMYFHMEGGE